jgi:hypothetical protein
LEKDGKYSALRRAIRETYGEEALNELAVKAGIYNKETV